MLDTNPLIAQVDNAVRQRFNEQENNPTDSEVRAQYELFYDMFVGIPGYSEFDTDRDRTINYLVDKYSSELVITKRLGFAYKDEKTKPWLREATERIESGNGWYYWNRYKDHLIRDKHWSKNIVRTIERDTELTLDLMADPTSDHPFERRGLVVASVQSGKTANYTGLICKAADAGYKIIVVMAGVHNVLRNQTQARLEEGFTGFKFLESNGTDAVGVGKNNLERRPVSMTSRDYDFNRRQAHALYTIQTDHLSEPLLFVIKKNTHSLKQVHDWLRSNAKSSDPLLLIDDEADNASINGKYKRDNREEDPTRINGQIRNILGLFEKKCYVGYTATPFANILIDPDVCTDEFGKDLFPSNFIYTLEESSDYFGATKVFDDFDDACPRYLRFIDDIDPILPPKHKSTHEIDRIPESLQDAIRTFILATTIRALRGDRDEHSTMMVNVSPYKQPQKLIAGEIGDYLHDLRDSIKSYAALDPEMALSLSTDLTFLYGTWHSEFKSTTEFSWEQIQSRLYEVVKNIHVVSINSNSPERLEYELHTEHVIAVGGYRLSRGLTLEGLVVSYYSRNAKAYDALMQMARWFGYRPGYEDLCRIWMSERSAGWYKFVADATSDLFDELRDMRQAYKTPNDYGLKIKQSPDSLIVTARNKMGTGTMLSAPIDLNSGFVETIAFDRDRSAIAANKEAVKQLLESAAQYKTKKHFYRGVPVKYIVHFLDQYINEDTRSPKSQKNPILNYIDDRQNDRELSEWDIFIAEGQGNEIDLGNGAIVRQEIRYPGSTTSSGILVVGEKQRLMSRGAEKIGLSDDEREIAEGKFLADHGDEGKSEKDTSDRYFRRERTYPLLIIHPVLMKYSERQKRRISGGGDKTPPAANWNTWDHTEEAYGWSISFPYTEKQTKTVEYVFNQIAMKTISDEFEEDSDDDYNDE